MSRPYVVAQVVARLLWGPSVVVAISLIVKGYTDVGDGFAAGVVVALGLALFYVALGASAAELALPFLRYAPRLMITGLLLCLGTGFFPLLSGEPIFSHLPEPGAHVATVGSLELFTPLLFDLGLFLLVVGVLTVLLHQLAGLKGVAEDLAVPPVDDAPTGGRRP
ncbi:MnhB domain-containing protein [Blastococcus mobilis]|uniref:Multicomponent Na+:H+ antiporter subunit B n=1 Tax=Blastococcus mobilis TaxID=1938746 RepID=A0A238USV8_9ACTN|nr:MnhB domain-containing protein [Blastococcus mobilis]SNR25118.1 multicomponent Na+:H+ antiporter subunit B [Blastococcus mobilis]